MDNTTSTIGNCTLIGDACFKHVTAKFSHIGDGDTIVYKDCDGNFAEVYHNESGEELVDLCQLGAADLDILGDLSFCDISSKAIEHLIQLGFGAENLPEFESCSKH